MKYVSIFSVTSKSAMTPSFIGLMATMLPGVRPSMSLASLPTAATRPFTLLIATIDGWLTTIPLRRAYTHVWAVPRSMARSLENSESIDRRLKRGKLRVESRWSKVESREPRATVLVHEWPCVELRTRGKHRVSTMDRRLPTVDFTVSVIGRSRSDLNAVFAGFLDAVHRPIGGLNQLLGRCRRVGQRR